MGDVLETFQLSQCANVYLTLDADTLGLGQRAFLCSSKLGNPVI